jgi:hypothetical protein
MLLMVVGLAIGTIILYIVHMLSCRCLVHIPYFLKLPNPVYCVLRCCYRSSCGEGDDGSGGTRSWAGVDDDRGGGEEGKGGGN